MVERETLLLAYDEQMRGVPSPPPAGVRYEQDGPLVRVVGQFRGFVSAPQNLGISGKELTLLVERQRDFFKARGEAVEWKTRAHDEPIELAQRLVDAGFLPEETETVMVGEAKNLATTMTVERNSAGFVVRQVTSPEDMRRIAHLQSMVWGKDFSWLADDLISRISAASENIVVLIAEAENQVVSAAWLVFRPGAEFASLWGGSTLQAWRRRGIYRALVAARARHAAAKGVRYLHVDASDDSKPILLRTGFQAITTTTPYVWSP